MSSWGYLAFTAAVSGAFYVITMDQIAEHEDAPLPIEDES